MVDQDLIDRCEHLSNEADISLIRNYNCLIERQANALDELLDNYKKLIESNAELHKELAKVRGESEQMQKQKQPHAAR